jgi:hypothetical protein
VTLSGDVFASEVSNLTEAVRAVRGVRRLENRLTRTSRPTPFPACKVDRRAGVTGSSSCKGTGRLQPVCRCALPGGTGIIWCETPKPVFKKRGSHRPGDADTRITNMEIKRLWDSMANAQIDLPSGLFVLRLGSSSRCNRFTFAQGPVGRQWLHGVTAGKAKNQFRIE